MILAAGSVATGIGLFLVFWGLGTPPRLRSARPIEERISYYGVRAAANPDDELEGSLLDRIASPQLARLRAGVARRTPSGHSERLDRDLALAGNPMLLTATDFIVVQAAATLVGAACSWAWWPPSCWRGWPGWRPKSGCAEPCAPARKR
jgi:hypothetical protein